MNNKHQPEPIKQWAIYQEGSKTPAYIRANSIRQRDNGYTLVADGKEISLDRKIIKIEFIGYA